MSIYFTPLMLSDDGKSRLPAPPGRLIDPAVVPVDPDKANLLERGENGLRVAPDAAVSKVMPNAIFVAPDNALRVELGLALQDETLILTGQGGEELGSVELPSSSVAPPQLARADILHDFTPPVPEGVLTPPPAGTYLHLQFRLADGSVKDIYINVQELVDVYTAGFAISIEDNVIGVVPARLLNPHEKLLTVRNGTIQAQPGLVFDAEKETLRLTGVNDALLAETGIPVSMGVPLDIVYERNKQVDNYPPADYLRFDYKAPDGQTRSEYVEMGHLAQTPVAGSGIAIDGDKISVKLGEAPDNALAVAKSGGLYVNRANLVSGVKDNALRLAADGRLYVEKSLAADSVGPGLVIGPDGKLSIDTDALVELLLTKLPLGVSADTDNALKLGSDKKPFFPGDLGKL